MRRLLPRLAWTTTALTLILVVLGAYVRLADAGLGCPDWPGCYGEWVLPTDAGALREAQARYPESRLDARKAHTEMAHRYLAAGVGLLVLTLTILAFRCRSRQRLAVAALLLVLFQALLGRWTVTLLLEPMVVVAHLLGGLSLLCLLCWLSLCWSPRVGTHTHAPALRPWLHAAGVVLLMQITLGGWTSANHAGLSCPDFPTCRGGSWWPPAADFGRAFLPTPGSRPDGALIAIHLAHRIGAALTLLALAATALRIHLRAPCAAPLGLAAPRPHPGTGRDRHRQRAPAPARAGSRGAQPPGSPAAAGAHCPALPHPPPRSRRGRPRIRGRTRRGG